MPTAAKTAATIHVFISVKYAPNTASSPTAAIIPPDIDVMNVIIYFERHAAINPITTATTKLKNSNILSLKLTSDDMLDVNIRHKSQPSEDMPMK